MSYAIADFTAQVKLVAGIFRGYGNKSAELTAIATALGTDTTKHDKTIETAPAGLRFGLLANTDFTDDVLRVVNRGKGGNLTPAAMGTAITNALAQLLPPVNTAAPVVSGTGTVGQTLTTTNGTWTNAPTSYQYQWLRASAPIFEATNSTYKLVAADSTFSVSCRVRANNAVGWTFAYSNAIAVT